MARLTTGLHSVHGDRVQLQQVVLNLILNAVEAMGSVEEGARDLWIATERGETGALAAVRDSGPGIDPEHLERVFEAFYTTKPGGIGMGLSICRWIIHAQEAGCGQRRTNPVALCFGSPCPALEASLAILLSLFWEAFRAAASDCGVMWTTAHEHRGGRRSR